MQTLSNLTKPISVGFNIGNIKEETWIWPGTDTTGRHGDCEGRHRHDQQIWSQNPDSPQPQGQRADFDQKTEQRTSTQSHRSRRSRRKRPSPRIIKLERAEDLRSDASETWPSSPSSSPSPSPSAACSSTSSSHSTFNSVSHTASLTYSTQATFYQCLLLLWSLLWSSTLSSSRLEHLLSHLLWLMWWISLLGGTWRPFKSIHNCLWKFSLYLVVGALMAQYLPLR